jgi:hypothetical protein
MEAIFANSNTTQFRKIKRSLNDGLSNLRRAHNQVKSTTFHLTFYLLDDGSIVTHREWREWRQLNNPFYIVAGTLKGCLGHWSRTICLQ